MERPAPAPRYELLDGMRGVAAVAVLLFHFGTRLGAHPLVPHGYLAVDFFFLLSGFVVAHAYAGRLRHMTLGRFARIRAIRFLPLSMLGVLMGTAYLLARWRIQPAASEGVGHLLAASLLNLALLPKPWHATLGQAGGLDEVFPANIVLWSLSLEMAANMAWTWVAFRPRLTLAIALAGAVLLTLVTLDRGNANIGWDLDSYVGGVGRAAFGFFLGVWLWRMRPAIRPRHLPRWVPALMLAGLLCLPIGGWAEDVAIVVVGLPSVLWLCLGADLRPERRVFRVLGELSYPLYAIHFPILMALSGALKRLHAEGAVEWWIYAAAPPIVALAWFIGRFYDAPLGRRLGRVGVPGSSGRLRPASTRSGSA